MNLISGAIALSRMMPEKVESKEPEEHLEKPASVPTFDPLYDAPMTSLISLLSEHL